jgi:hypothetical protein
MTVRVRPTFAKDDRSSQKKTSSLFTQGRKELIGVDLAQIGPDSAPS